MKTLVVIGQGYVGLPMALRAAAAGISVFGLDTNKPVVDKLNSGSSHIDDVTDLDLVTGLEAGYQATTDPSCISIADVVVVCVPTPLAPEGGPDLRPVISAGETIGLHVRPGTLCILESTTYPGTTEEIFAPLVSSGGLRIGQDINVAFSPERIDPGNKEYGVKNTPKVVGGVTPDCTLRAKEFYELFIDSVITTNGAKEAEMAKLLENTFRHVNIALMNEMVRFSQDLDIDLWDAIDAAATKPFGFMPFRPGPGVGGHCIPIDPTYLSHRVKAKLGYAFRMVELAEEINHAAPEYVAARVASNLNSHGKSVKGSTILLLGVTYKPDITDCRESPADPLAVRLESMGATVMYHDFYVPVWKPKGSKSVLQSVDDPFETQESADLTILLQAHSEYDLDRLSNNGNILDTRGKLKVRSTVDRL